MGANGALDARLPVVDPDSILVSLSEIDAVVLVDVLARVSEGDFAARMPAGWVGVAGKAADSLNSVIAANQSLAIELDRIYQVVGKQGELSQRVQLTGCQ